MINQIRNQLFPKAFKSPPYIRTYRVDGISYENMKSFLFSLTVSDKLFGLECFITKDKVEPFFITEEHKVDLPIKKAEAKLILREYGESSCFNLYSRKSSVFPFMIDQLEDRLDFTELQTTMKEESIVLQILCLKRHSDYTQDKLWDQYEDYVNLGIDVPTNNRLIRSMQHKVSEFIKKIEGGYRRNLRIDEAEQKLTEDMFQVECRYMIFGGNRESRRRLSHNFKRHFSEMDYINEWATSEDKDSQGFFGDMQLRKPSIGAKQILCVSELLNLMMIPLPQVVEEVQEVVVDILPETIKEVETEEKLEPNNPFSIFPRGTKKSRENDIHFSDKFNKALKKLSLVKTDVVIQKISHGATLQKITFNLPVGLKLTDLVKATENIQTELGFTSISFEQSDTAGCVSMVIPQEERELVMVRDCVESLTFKDLSSKYELPILIGTDSEGNVILTCLTLIKHLLIAGSTGQGKSVFLNSLLTVLFALISPKHIQVYMIDPKKVELNCYSDFPHVQNVYTNMDEAEAVLYHLTSEMEKRYELFQKKGYKNIQQYNRNEKDKLQYQIVVIDELADLIMTHPETEDFIVRIAQMGRAAGYHLIIATQKPYEDIITGLIKTNIYSRICFMCEAGSSYKVALDEIPKYSLLGKGDGVCRLEGAQGLVRFQGALIAKVEEEQDKIIKQLSSFWKEKVKKEVIDLTSARERRHNEDLKRMKRIVLDTGETRLGELQKILSIRNERVKELMIELESLGWVKKHKSKTKGYELLLTSEERKQHLQDIK